MLRRFSSTPLSCSAPALLSLISDAAAACDLTAGEKLHSNITKLGFISNPYISTALLNLYLKCSLFSAAHRLFDEMSQRTVVTYNTLIYSYSQTHVPSMSIIIFKDLLNSGLSPTSSTISSISVAGAQLGDLRIAIMLHCVGIKLGCCDNIVAGTSLVDLYAKCYDMVSARKMFDSMPEKNVITYTSLVTGFTLEQNLEDAMILIRQMRRNGIELNQVTYNSVLSGVSTCHHLVYGKQVHCLVVKQGLSSDHYMVVTLVTMYSRCRLTEDFDNARNELPVHDHILCNSIIAGFSNLGEGMEVLKKFFEMRQKGIDTDFFAFTSVLGAVGHLSLLEEGRQVHALVIKTEVESILCVQNGLLSMYTKCGELDESKKVFNFIDEPDIVSWNGLISGFAQHGRGKEAVEMFERMRKTSITPNTTTFLSVLTACSHVGLVNEGLAYFNIMKEDDFVGTPGPEHYACVVDLLCRAGRLDEAELFIKNMPVKPSISVYKALLSACQSQGNVEIANRVANCLFELSPNDTATYVLLSNAFAVGDNWSNAAGVRRMMFRKGLRKQPAWSCIDQ